MDEPADRDARTLSVEVMAVRYRVADGDFAVVSGLTDEGDEVTVTGALGHVHEGESVRLQGAWRRHASHGWQFAAQRVRIDEPISEQALLSYLGAVKHLGIAGSRWLLDRHGAGVLAAIDADPGARLGEVPGIGRAKLPATLRSWEEQHGQHALRLFLDDHGVPASAAGRIHRHFGTGSLAALQADPYALTEVEGIGFATADALARALGTPSDAEGRIDAGIVHVLHDAEGDGHCLLPRGELRDRALRLLDIEVDARLAGLAERGRIVIDGDGRVSEAAMDATERRLAARVSELLAARPVLEVEDPVRPSGDGAPTDAQWAVVDNVLAHRLSILTGLPGTGKTATMRALVALLDEAGHSVRLCAPTGKAARRLTQSTGAEASTIHRMLEWGPEGFGRGADEPIAGADVLVVDEASMLGVRLAAALLDAVGPKTHVLLVGDVDQLAPVGPGRVLEDLIEGGRVPTVRLTEVFRQAARSMIVRAAHAINGGIAPPTTAGEGDLHDFFVIARSGPQAIFEEVCALAASRLPAHFGLAPVGEVQVLAPMHKGPVGVEALNAELRARLNPDGRPIAGTAFRLDDRVIQTRNSYDLELMNGELGVLVSFDAQRGAVLLAGDDGRRLHVPLRELSSFRLAYAMSVHKAQGSQVPVVVVPLFTGHRAMLTRNLLYTAVTRAERATVLVGEPAALDLALGRRDAHRRHTRLTELVARAGVH